MITIARPQRPVVIYRKNHPVKLMTQPKVKETTVVRATTALPIYEAVLPDPGDLTLIFENGLV